ncbi:hypothetical protein M2405_001318 [Rhodococcus erythropolis]|nr:hypothetical protein [Rhodococcus erythropolis]MCW2428513.1 hypothetical protein [Rhodococcus erythropolis]
MLSRWWCVSARISGWAPDNCAIRIEKRPVGMSVCLDMATRNFRHSKCYANTDGGCSSKISGEHYISHSLIKLYTFDDPDVTIQHDHGLGVRRPVQPKKFVANVLCEAHNNGLSGADAAALQFATFLRTIAIRYRGGSGEWGTDESVEISGDDFQRWVLKLLLTHASAGAFASDETVVKGPIPDDSIHLLLDRAEWPRTWGLYVASDVTNQHLRFDPFSRVETVTTDWWSAYPKFAAADSAIYGASSNSQVLVSDSVSSTRAENSPRTTYPRARSGGPSSARALWRGF